MNKKANPTVVIDTNLLISALITKNDSTPSKLLAEWREDRYNLVISEELIDEAKTVLRREKIYKKYHISPEEINELIEELNSSTLSVEPLPLSELYVHSRDLKDDKLLACALAGDCNYLITGDNDLLVLNGNPAIGNLQIITATQFLSLKLSLI